MDNNPFNNSLIRDWFCSDIDLEFSSFPKEIITVGSDPFEEQEFDEFLGEIGIVISGMGADFDTLVIGRQGWSEESLNEQIELRKGKELRVYSQEMAISYLVCERDPYDTPEILETFGEEHPALEYLRESGFDWPKTYVVPIESEGELDGYAWQKLGYLKFMGYTVGNYGKPLTKRRRILEQIFSSELPNVMPDQYKAEWGRPNSARRLIKMSNSIASFARIAKRRHDSPNQAIQDWESDLEWLKNNFYRGRFRFVWPSTYIRT